MVSDLVSQSPAINPPLETSPLQAFSTLACMCMCERERVQAGGKSTHLAERQEKGEKTSKKSKT